MTKGRKATAAVVATLPAIDEAAVTADLQAADHGHMVALRKVQDSALDVGRIAGRIESMLFLRTVGDRVIAEAFVQLREGKKYKDLLIDDGEGNLRPVGDLKEACSHLFGKSYNVCAELAQNYEALGAELYDKAQQIGLHTKDYRAIRALPAADQELVQQAIETATDRDAVAELFMELTERHAKKVLRLEEESSAKDKVIAQGKEHIAKLVEDKNRRERLTETEQQAELEQSLGAAVLEASAYLLPVRQAVHDVRALDKCPAGLSAALEGALNRIAAEVLGIATDYGVVLNLTPDWIDAGVRPLDEDGDRLQAAGESATGA